VQTLRYITFIYILKSITTRKNIVNTTGLL